MSTHTPGPWKLIYSGDTIVVVGPRENCKYNGIEPRWEMCKIDNSCMWDYPVHEQEDKANARLIAAAPDLLEAAKAARIYVQTCADDWTDTPASRALQALDAAIAKAEGRSTKAEAA